jgi:hypothetical protein
MFRLIHKADAPPAGLRHRPVQEAVKRSAKGVQAAMPPSYFRATQL